LQKNTLEKKKRVKKKKAGKKSCEDGIACPPEAVKLGRLGGTEKKHRREKLEKKLAATPEITTSRKDEAEEVSGKGPEIFEPTSCGEGDPREEKGKIKKNCQEVL